ncbi:hypothetical protein FJTKL_14094 [Diaporthe vaccinii]|uniref:J domain-containing protein n=1 Tax=Diaporthe vaccinii TaxID=105482 RepID=A0ABR4E938_9PEZI
MSLLRTSSTLRRLFVEPAPLYKPCAPAARRVGGPSQSQTTTTRPPWAHQTRLSSSDDKGSGQDDDPYKVLGVPSNIPQSKIKPAYYAQAKKLHPDASKRQNSLQFVRLRDAYDRLSTPEARKRHDDEVRERERATQQARDAAATRQAAQSKQPRKDKLSSADEGRFVKRESLEWMKKFQKSKGEADVQRRREADAQRERDLATQRRREADAQRKRDLAAQRSQRQSEVSQMEKEQRDREAAFKDRDRQEAPAQTKAANGGTASHEKSEPRPGHSPRDKAGQAGCDEDKREAASARKPTVGAKPESLRVAILRLSPGTTIPDVVKRLSSFAVGSVAEIQITGSGVAKLDFFSADAARKLQHLIHGEKFTVNGKKVKDMMALQVSVLPVPQDPLASRVLMLTDRNDELPELDSQHVKFILRQNGHVCPWLELNRLSRARTEVHFSSWREAEKASQILRCEFPSVPVRYAIDPATGDKETPPTFLGAIFRGTDFPDTKFWLFVRYSLIYITLFLIASALWDFCLVPFMSSQGSGLPLRLGGTEDSEVLNS